MPTSTRRCATASARLGRELEFDEAERLTIEQAAKAVDRAEELQAMCKAELAPEA